MSGLLKAELEALGGRGVKQEPGGCRVRGPLAFGYKICLWSRVASRVLLLLRDEVVENEDGLYTAVREIAWEEHVRPDGSIAVEFVGDGAGISHTRYGAQRVKDAIVDRFRDRTGVRPSVDRETPDVRAYVHVRGRGCSIGLDLSGQSLHRRGYRTAVGEAPIKENLAAALLMYGGWPGFAAEGHRFVDPMCGAGTIVIEAAWIACDVAPGLLRPRFGFHGWLGHDAAAWDEVLAIAKARAEEGKTQPLPPMRGFDADPRAVAAARANAERAGVGTLTEFTTVRVSELTAPAEGELGLVATNPPYGERMGDKTEAHAGLAELGRVLKQTFVGWSSVIIASDDGLLHAVGLPFADTLEVSNGPHAALFARFEPPSQAALRDHPFSNRLRKNLRHLRRWVEREQITCYRVYDGDMPEYNVAVDVYGSSVHVQEYEPPDTVDPEAARRRLSEATSLVAEVLAIPGANVHLKTRRRQRGPQQYERQSDEGRFMVVREGGHSFWVNLTDYLDTGLFLDHRMTRAMIERSARGMRFLNLFCYTGTATVYAACGGAKTTTSVDLSNTYLDWAKRNFEINDVKGPDHRLIRADGLEWLERERGLYDLVFLDPPTFSNSAAMDSTLDIRRDHVQLIDRTMARVAPQGMLLFSTNSRRFRLDPAVSERYEVEDLTARTTPKDFAKGLLHRCWKLQRK